MFDEFGHGASAGGGAGKQGRPAAQSARVPQRTSHDRFVESPPTEQVFAIGGNETTLAVVSSLRAGDDGTVSVALLPLARTPLGVEIGEGRQEARVPRKGLFDWIDRTFPAEDEHAFVASVRDLELLARVEWDAPFPARVDESCVVNAEDLPDEVAEGLASPPAALAQCSACRRLCVLGDFVWKEKQLCAWDYHAQVFGKRGPWRQGPYEERHFETLPSCAYVVVPLLDELGVQVAVAGALLDDATERAVVNAVLGADLARAHLAVRTERGVWVLREA